MIWLLRLRRFLFDFSGAQANRQEVADILRATLILSRADTDFPATLERVLHDWEGGPEQGRARYYTFIRFMALYRRRADPYGEWRRRAEHLLEDLPRIYGD